MDFLQIWITYTLYFLVGRKIKFLLCKESGFHSNYGIVSANRIKIGVQLMIP